MPDRRLGLRLSSEHHRGIGQNRALLRLDGHASHRARGKQREEDEGEPSHGRVPSEVDAEAAGIGLGVLVRLGTGEPAGREDREVGDLETEEDPAPQGEEQPASGPGKVEVLLGEHERFGVGDETQPPHAQAQEGTDWPAWREVDARPYSVDELRTFTRERIAEEAVDREGLVNDDRRTNLHVAVPLYPEPVDA